MPSAKWALGRFVVNASHRCTAAVARRETERQSPAQPVSRECRVSGGDFVLRVEACDQSKAIKGGPPGVSYRCVAAIASRVQNDRGRPHLSLTNVGFWRRFRCSNGNPR